MRKNKKVILAFITALTLILTAGIIYLNRVILPVKVKSLIINNLQDLTQKKVSLKELQFNIFKGLVLRDLSIYDENKTFLELKEASCTFFILPVFKKMIIIPTVKIKSPNLFLKRRPDNAFNIQDIISKITAKKPKSKFTISVYKISVSNCTLRFEDDTFPDPFTKSMQKLNINISLSLPASVKFRFKAEIPANPVMKMNGMGEFLIPREEWRAKISLQNFSPKEFRSYYQNLGINFNEGLLDSLLNLKVKDKIIYLNLEAGSKNLLLNKDKISVRLNSNIKADIKYAFQDKQLDFSGKAQILNADLSGLDYVDKIGSVNGEIAFNNSGISADRLLADFQGAPIQARLNLSDFKNPLFKLNVTSSLSLDLLTKILKDKFNFSIPVQLNGGSKLSLDLNAKEGIFQLNGSLDFLNASAKIEKINSLLEEIKGRIDFSQNGLKWQDLNLKYQGEFYKTSGALTNFQSPGVQLALSSQDLSLESSFSVNQQMVNFSRFCGKYRNSEFSVQGSFNTIVPDAPEAEVGGGLDIALEDMQVALKKYKNQLEQIKPSGMVHAKFDFSGNINDFKSCAINAEFSGPSVSAYGLKAKDFFLNYSQKDGLIDVPLARLSLYEGTIEAAAKMNLNSDNLPYWFNTDIRGVKLEKLKLDTGARKEDIAGTIQAQFKINGFNADISKLSGAGHILINDGKLWQLDLFKGLGSLLFAKDYFAQIIFHEGSCDFLVRDKYIFTDNLKLKSDITDLSGSVKIGFDNSIDASLNVQVQDEFVPLSGTFKDVTTAIIGEAGRFGVIKISGTLKEPKYKFRPAVGNIINGLKKAIFGK
ncbi:MAG: AsmA family protein [Candidatus Omnitrophica bacterium]|nr:AsmA family protein [Candidatus Omnitrophota bacterium]MDD5238205.1 AsmA family protein [Candidatus Omnitrophota bacterium]